MADSNRARLLDLAERCEAGAADLTYEAEHAAEVLAGRAGGDQTDPQAWAARQAAAAQAARQYAQSLRAEAAAMAEGQQASEERVREAEKVADAANLGGILIDGQQLTDAALDSPWHSAETRQAISDAQHAKTAAIEGSGQFDHVTNDGEVAYWQLGATGQADTAGTGGDQPAAAQRAEASDEF